MKLFSGDDYSTTPIEPTEPKEPARLFKPADAPEAPEDRQQLFKD